MAHATEQKIKLLVLYDLLCQLTDEDHALNTDEIIALLAEKKIAVSRKILLQDIALLNEYGYEVLTYKKKYHFYYVVNRHFDSAEIAFLADAVQASKLSATQKQTLTNKLMTTIAVFFISLTVWVIFFIKIKKCWYKKDYHNYLYRDNNGLFSISIIEKDNNPTITQIVNCDEMFLFDGEEKEKIIWRKFERYSGIKQFTLSPNEVFSDADQGLIIYKTRLKRTNGK